MNEGLGSTGIGSLPLVVGLGAAVEAVQKRSMATVEKRIIELRHRAYAGFRKIPKIQLVSPPPGPLATPLVAFKLPDSVDSREFRALLLKKYRFVVKVIGEEVFNGEYLKPLFAFVTSRHTDQDNDMYDRWKVCHERMLRPAYGEDIETAITPDLYDALYEQVKARVLAYIPELADHQDKPVAMLLIKAGMRKEIGKRQRVQ